MLLTSQVQGPPSFATVFHLRQLQGIVFLLAPPFPKLGRSDGDSDSHVLGQLRIKFTRPMFMAGVGR